MKQLKLTLAFSIAALALVGYASAPKGDKATFVKMYKMIAASIKKMDVDSFVKGTTDDYTEKHLDGKSMTRDEVVAQIKEYMKVTKSMDKVSAVVSKVQSSGDDATVWATITMDMHVMNPMNPDDKKVHKLHEVSKSKDMWVMSGGEWKMKSSTVLADKMTMDGKPYKM